MTAAPGRRRPARSVYPVRRAYFARALGRTATGGAVLMLLSTAALTLGAPGLLNALLVLLTSLVLVGVAVIAVSVMLPPTLLQLDADGFRAGRRYSSGPRQAQWVGVRSVASQQGPDGWVLLLQHDDGQITAVPLRLADADPVTVEQDVRDRLDQAHGYRSMP